MSQSVKAHMDIVWWLGQPEPAGMEAHANG